jgi:hypothetical protein
MVSPADGTGDGKAKPAEEQRDNPERRFFAALAEIRALKRAANQGE